MEREPRLDAIALPWSLVSAVILAVLFFGMGPNPGLATAALAVLLVIAACFLRPGESPVLLYIFVFQWIEASIWIFYSSVNDLAIDDGTATGAERQLATLLLLLGLLTQSIGVRLAIGPRRSEDRELVAQQLGMTPQGTWLGLYLGSLVAAVVASYLATVLPGLRQPLLAVVSLRWAAYVAFTVSTFFRADANRAIWFLVFSLELLSSIGEYFSSFKFVFIFTFVGVAASQVKFSAYLKIGLAIVVSVALLFGTLWSAIKGEYRNFASQGERAQVVDLGFSERIAKIADLLSGIGIGELRDGFDILVRRIEYVEYFADVTNTVPDAVPHTRGELWWDAISRPLMPRLFFPSKASIDESDLTNRFTGNRLAGVEQGTQISLGYMAETYIDFGEFLMVPILFCWGLFFGWTYRWQLRGHYTRGVLGVGLVSSTYILTSGSVGNSLAKLVGGLIVCLLVNWAFSRFVVPRWLPWLRAK